MAVSNDFTEYVLDKLDGWGQIVPKRMFGGVGLFRNGLMFGMIANDIVYLKIDELTKIKYESFGSTPFQPFANKKSVLSFYNIPDDIFEDSEQFLEWAKESYSIQERSIQ